MDSCVQFLSKLGLGSDITKLLQLLGKRKRKTTAQRRGREVLLNTHIDQ